MLMHWSRLLRRGALCALLLLIARLLSSSLFESDSDVMQYFRAVRGRSAALDADSDVLPVLASVYSRVQLVRHFRDLEDQLDCASHQCHVYVHP